jgi:hypothetical protein
VNGPSGMELLAGVRSRLEAGEDVDLVELDAVLDAVRTAAANLGPAELVDLAAAVASVERAATVRLTETGEAIGKLAATRHGLGGYASAIRPAIRGQRLRIGA